MTEPTPDPLVNPLSGEILDPSDMDGLRDAQRQLEDWLGHNDVHRLPVWKTSRHIQNLLADSPYGVPSRVAQTDTQKRLERCPRCREVLEVEK